MPLEIGQSVQQVVHPITGTIDDVRYDAQGKAFTYLVTYLDAAGEVAQRWFDEAEVEAA